MSESIYAAGYQAAIEGNYNCPYAIWTFDFWSWQAGNLAGHQIVCAQQEAIFLHYPQD